jgi:hypothetical protein
LPFLRFAQGRLIRPSSALIVSPGDKRQDRKRDGNGQGNHMLIGSTRLDRYDVYGETFTSPPHAQSLTEMDGVLMRRKGLEWRSKKYAPVQNVSVVNGYMDAEDFRQKYKTGRVGVKKRMSPAAGGQNHMMIYGPKSDGTYVVEFKTATGEALAMSVPRRETAVLKHFQERMPYGLFVQETR